jgi:perosamine synthetase
LRRLRLARPEVGEAELEGVRKVIESGWLTQGPRVAEFELMVARWCGRDHAVATSSCTTALHLALVAAGVGPGDEVIAPSMSFIATVNSIVHSGATPVFAEVDPVTFNLDLVDVARRVTPRTRAIMLVHQLGLPADIAGFSRFAADRGLRLIEDAACALGSTYRGVPIGGHSELVCFSFHPRKVVTTGDGGMVLTNSAEAGARMRRLRHHGMSVSDLERHTAPGGASESYDEVGYNYRLTDVQAAIGIEQLRKLPDMIRGRRKLAQTYDHALRAHPLIETPSVPEGSEWNVQTYAVRLAGFTGEKRDAVMREMDAAGIDTRRGVMTAHREPAYAHMRISLPVSEKASDGSLVIPLHLGLTPADCEFVALTLAAAVDRVARPR